MSVPQPHLEADWSPDSDSCTNAMLCTKAFQAARIIGCLLLWAMTGAGCAPNIDAQPFCKDGAFLVVAFESGDPVAADITVGGASHTCDFRFPEMPPDACGPEATPFRYALEAENTVAFAFESTPDWIEVEFTDPVGVTTFRGRWAPVYAEVEQNGRVCAVADLGYIQLMPED